MAKHELSELEQRGLKLSAKVLFIIDGGKGVAKALTDRYGRKLQVHRCTIHKDRNLQAHLPKKYHFRVGQFGSGALRRQRVYKQAHQFGQGQVC